jgi:hypothetical protein
MSNDFYTNSESISRRTLARAETLAAEFQAVQAGFDKLPTEAQLQRNTSTIATDSGAANAYVLTLAFPPAAYTANMEIVFRPGATNTGPATVNAFDQNGVLLGVKAVKRADGADVVAGDLPAAGYVTLRYDGTTFRLAGAQPGDLVQANAAADEARAAADLAQAATGAVPAAAGNALKALRQRADESGLEYFGAVTEQESALSGDGGINPTITYTDGLPTSVTDTFAGSARTQTLAYTDGLLTTYTVAWNSLTRVVTLTYTDGVLTSTAKSGD